MAAMVHPLLQLPQAQPVPHVRHRRHVRRDVNNTGNVNVGDGWIKPARSARRAKTWWVRRASAARPRQRRSTIVGLHDLTNCPCYGQTENTLIAGPDCSADAWGRTADVTSREECEQTSAKAGTMTNGNDLAALVNNDAWNTVESTIYYYTFDEGMSDTATYEAGRRCYANEIERKTVWSSIKPNLNYNLVCREGTKPNPSPPPAPPSPSPPPPAPPTLYERGPVATNFWSSGAVSSTVPPACERASFT